MSKPRRTRNETKLVESPVYPVVTLGNREFEIHPMTDREDEKVYEDNAEFLAIAVPVGTRLYSEIIDAGSKNETIVNRIVKAKNSGEDEASTFLDIFTLISKLDMGTLIDEVADALPKLGAIACHYTDPDVTVQDIKQWSKGPLNYMLWKAVVGQVKAEGIMSQFTQLQGLMGEFKAA